MNAPSPVQLAVSIPHCTVSAGGQQLPSTAQLVSVDIWSGVNKIPRARIVLSDGSAAEEDFPISDSPLLVPGASIAISMGYGSSASTVFSGVVYRQGLEASINGPSRLVVEATDPALVMTLARRNALFENITDSQLCKQLIEANELKARVSATSTQHASIVQYYASDWDLLVLRAQASGMVVAIDAGVVAVAPPDTGAAPILTLTYGESLLDFRANMDASTQFAPASIQSVAWDPATQALARAGQAESSVTTPGNISSNQLADVFKVRDYLQQTPGAMQAAELTQWSSAELMKSQLSKIRGEARFQGSALVRPGCMVALEGLGSRFNGNAYVSGLHHRFSEGLWRTTVEIGLSPQWFASSAPHVAAPGASGQLPPANNLQTGTVQQIDQDPDGEFRVLVILPLLQAGAQKGVWARFGSFYASKDIGSCFYPEIGDEVVVAFLGGDPRYPVILGSLYSKKNPPPTPPEAANKLKSFVTRSKLHIDFDEESPAIKLVTPGKQSVEINDKDKSIKLTDMHGNTITLDGSGIELKSAKDITLSAAGSITVSAQSALTAKGSGSAQITSSGTVRVSGATVALNP